METKLRQTRAVNITQFCVPQLEQTRAKFEHGSMTWDMPENIHSTASAHSD